MEADEEAQVVRLEHAHQLIVDHKPMAAIVGPLEEIISRFENHVVQPGTKFYCARTTTESLMYLIGEAADDIDVSEDSMVGNGKAVVVGPVWAYAYQLKGYALLELKRAGEAQAALQKAVDLSPQNSQFLSELAYSHQKQGHLARSLDLYNSAEEAAKTFTPDDLKTTELTRALRGQGYVLVEMGKLSEGEERYRASLKLDPADELSKNELRYISGLREKQAQ